MEQIPAKLSKLQRWILNEALKREHENNPYGYLTRRWILLAYFRLAYHPTNLRIQKSVDPIRYNRANAAMHRAIGRLEARGLVFRGREKRDRILLTRQGLRVARALKIGSFEPSTQPVEPADFVLIDGID